MRNYLLRFAAALAIAILAAESADTAWGQPGPGGGRGMGRGGGGGFRGGRGDPSFVTDRDTFHELLGAHEKVARTVTLRDDGVETLTESDDPAIAAKIKEHVTAMKSRLEEGRPIRMRDPLFAALFQHADQVVLEYETTDRGVRVIETAEDPFVVKLIQAHARVVSGFAERGFDEARLNHAVPAAEATAAADRSQLDETTIAALQRTYVQIDRAFIPALALTDRQQPEPSRGAILRLQKLANALQSTSPAGMADSAAWLQGLEEIQSRAAEALQLVDDGQLKEAHEHLEPIRGALVKQRKTLGVPYPLDALAAFHDRMEPIVKPAAAALAAGDVYDAAAIQRCRTQLAAAWAAWDQVESTKFDSNYLELTPQQQLRIELGIIDVNRALKVLAVQLEHGDAQATMRAAKGLKPPFAQIYTTFGDFPGGQPPAFGEQAAK